jgi:hypothetical protein
MQLSSVLIVLWLSACAPVGPTAFITQNVKPDGSCIVTPDADVFLPSGSYDISPGKKGACLKPYTVNLLVNSYLRENANGPLGRAEPNLLLIHRAKVTLKTLDGKIFDFNDGGGGGGDRPNPFLTTTSNAIPPSSGTKPSTGIASVEVIPASYAERLNDDMVVGGNIQAEIEIFGTTTGDVDIDLAPFTYTIEICDGCMTLCNSKLVEMDMTPMDLAGEECPDGAGADGRICIDPDC